MNAELAARHERHSSGLDKEREVIDDAVSIFFFYSYRKSELLYSHSGVHRSRAYCGCVGACQCVEASETHYPWLNALNS